MPKLYQRRLVVRSLNFKAFALAAIHPGAKDQPYEFGIYAIISPSQLVRSGKDVRNPVENDISGLQTRCV
jgi:hypothetical protein